MLLCLFDPSIPVLLGIHDISTKKENTYAQFSETVMMLMCSLERAYMMVGICDQIRSYFLKALVSSNRLSAVLGSLSRA